MNRFGLELMVSFMLYVELINGNPDGQTTSRIEKKFDNLVEFAYFYECAKRDNWQFINVRTFNPQNDEALTLNRTLDLLGKAVSV